ncbi:MAG TPA: SMC family ATPase [Methanoregulaceae archaeon]|nr:SMC family ATPase [Methanoregulaceae archaeon]
MRLISLALSNIRSYGKEETFVEFPPGVTLFWGDIGSGKSTILAAIEFGLFGLGDLKKTHLLRHGARRGDVTVRFAVDGIEYAVHRAIQRRARRKDGEPGSVEQVDGWLEEDGVRTPYSTTELKARVLAVLGFNERADPKAGSRIYRYAVYTPQEEMKQVLLLGREERLDILRRAFGLEQYRWARLNIDEHLVRGAIAPEQEVLAGQASRLPAVGEEERRLLEEEARLGEEEDGIEEACRAIEDACARLGEEIRPLAAARPERDRLAGEHRSLVAVLAQDKAELDQADEAIRGLEGAIAPRGPEEEDRFQDLAARYAEWEELERERAGLRAAAEQFRALEAERRELAGAIERERERIAGSLDALRRRAGGTGATEALRELEAEAARLGEEERRLEEALAPEPGLAEETALCRETRGRVIAERGLAEERQRRVEAEWEAIAAIGVGAPCPTCHQTLGADHLARVREGALAEAGRLEARVAECTEILRLLDRDLAVLEERQRACEQVRRALAGVRAERDRLEGRRRELVQRKEEEARAREECDRLARLLASGAFGAAERERLARVEAGLEAVRQEAARYDACEAAIGRYEAAGVVEAYRAAARAREAALEAARRLAGRREERERIALRLREREERRAALERELAVLDGTVARLEALEEELGRLRERAEAAGKERVRVRVERGRLGERLGAVRAEKERLQELERRCRYLGEVQRWLLNHVVPAIVEIEAGVLDSIRDRFEALFADWFARLVESDDLRVAVDASFSPVVRSGEYELEHETLSGGERTSLALAYRLALSTMVRQEAGITRESLLVLDEPTDGFSSQQLNRLREVLAETGCDQTIIVSHEQELEGVADTVYGVTKESSGSRVVLL